MPARRFLAFWRCISRAGNAESAARQVLTQLAACKRKRTAVSSR